MLKNFCEENCRTKEIPEAPQRKFDLSKETSPSREDKKFK